MAPYGATSDVRELARTVIVSEFPDSEILEEQLAAQAKIWTITNKNDWDSNDIQFEFVKKLEIKQAAIYVLEHYNVIDILPVLESWKTEVKEGLQEIIDSSTDPSLDDPIVVIASKYESYPASLDDDPNARPYRSTNINV